MEWFWKPIIAPLIVAAIVGTAAFYWGRATAPETPQIEAALRWFDVPNPVRDIRPGTAEREGAAATLFGVTGMGAALADLQYSGELRIGLITISNTSRVRTGEIELAFKERGRMILAGEKEKVATKDIKIKYIDPNTSRTIYLVSETWSSRFGPDPLSLLHDNRRIDIKKVSAESSELATFDWLEENSGTIGAIAMVVFGFFVIGFLSVVFGIIAIYNVKFRAFMLDKSQIQRMLEAVEYIKKHHPEKMPTPTPEKPAAPT